jgi:hypothetical protein
MAHQARGLKKMPKSKPPESEIAQSVQNTAPIPPMSPPVRTRLPITQNIMPPQSSFLKFGVSMKAGSARLLGFFRNRKPSARPRGQTEAQNDRGLVSVIIMAATINAARASPSSGMKIPPQGDDGHERDRNNLGSLFPGRRIFECLLHAITIFIYLYISN